MSAAQDTHANRRRTPGARAAFLAWARSVRVGTVVPIGRTAAPVIAIDDYPPGHLRPACPAPADQHARRLHTTRGDRWVWWHPTELPNPALPFPKG